MKRIIFCLFAISICIIMTTSCCCCSDPNISSTGSTNSTDTTNSPDIGQAFQKGFKYGWDCESARQAFDKGEHDKAISLYKEAIGVDPDDKEAYIGISNVYMAQGEYNEAITNLNKAQVIDPKDENVTSLIEKAQSLINNK